VDVDHFVDELVADLGRTALDRAGPQGSNAPDRLERQLRPLGDDGLFAMRRGEADAAVLGKTCDNQVCSTVRAFDVVGERWGPLIIRYSLFAGVTRFGDFQHDLGVATNVLATPTSRGAR
jgi:hypothetical protein